MPSAQWKATALPHTCASCGPVPLRSRDGDELSVSEKLRGWADPDSETADGGRPLHQALAQGHLAVARQLILYRADVWQQERGRTGVMVALESPEAMELLLETHKDDKAWKRATCHGACGERFARAVLGLARTPKTWPRAVAGLGALPESDRTTGGPRLGAKAAKPSSAQLASSRSCWTQAARRPCHVDGKRQLKPCRSKQASCFGGSEKRS